MHLTQDQISRLLKLTGLSTRTQKEFSIESILESFKSLQEADVTGIETVGRSGNGTLTLRPDVARTGYITSPYDLLHLSKQKVLAHQIALSGIMHTDS